MKTQFKHRQSTRQSSFPKCVHSWSGWLPAMYLVTASWFSPGLAPAVTTLAILSGERERAPSAELVARIEADLSSTPDLALVERALLRKVLAEQELNAAGALKPGASVRLGRLLAADLFLFIHKVASQETAGLDLQWVETRTGVVLQRRLVMDRGVDRNREAIIELNSAALKRLTIPPAGRQAMAILGLRSEEPGRAFDGPLAALEALLAADLATIPTLALLEREHLEHLTAEKNLAGGELALRASALLLEGGIRHSPDKSRWIATVLVTQLQGGAPARASVEVDVGDISGAREQLAGAVAKLLELPLRIQGGKARQEAAVFATQAALLLAHDDMEGGVRAAEAALALCPCEEHREQAAGAWAWLSYKRSLSANDTSPASVRRLLQASLRMWELQEAAIAEHLAAWQRAGAPPLPLPLVPNHTVALRVLALEVKPSDAETAALRAGLQQAALRTFRTCREHYLRLWGERPAADAYSILRDPHWHWMRLQEEWIEYLALLTDDVRDWTCLLDEVIGTLDGPAADPVAARSAFDPLYHRVSALTRIHAYALPARFGSVKDQDVIERCYDTLAAAGSRDVALACLAAKMNYNGRVTGKRDPATARTVLERYLAEPGIDPQLGKWNFSEPFPVGVVREAFDALATAGEKDGFAHRLLDPLVRAGDGPALRRWEALAKHVVAALDYSGRREDGLAWLERLLPLLHERAPMNSTEAATLRTHLDGVLLSMAFQMGRFYETGAGWEAYEVERLKNPRLEVMPTKGPRAINRLDIPRVLASTIDEECLLLAWAQGAPNAVLWVTGLPLDGNPEILVGQTHLPLPFDNPVGAPRLRGLAGSAAELFIATAGGLLAVRDGDIVTPSQDARLPSGNILSLARLGGRLFLGLHDGGLVEFDPVTGRSVTLASSRSLEARHELDGGAPYAVMSLAADELRDCLWFSVGAQIREGAPVPRQGLWRYVPSASRLERIPDTGLRLEGIELQQDRLFMVEGWADSWTALFVLDPETLHRTTLLNPVSHPSRARGQSVFGAARIPLWPCAWLDGQLLVSGDRTGQLHIVNRAQHTPATMNHLPVKEVVRLHPISGTVYVTTTPGEVWRIGRKPSKGALPARAAFTHGTPPSSP
jgi:hypothetical protein